VARARRRLAKATYLGVSLALAGIAACSLVDPLDGLSDNFGKTDGGGTPDGGGDQVAPDARADAAPDASDADAAPLRCDPTKAFGAPVPLNSINTSEQEGSARLTPDELTLYFDGVREGGAGGNSTFDIFVTTRLDGGDSFGPPTRLVPPSTTTIQEYAPSLTDDGLTLFFERQPIGSSDDKIYMTKRATTASPFADPPTLVNGVNSPGYDANPFVRGDATELWFVATGATTEIDVYVAELSGGVYSPVPVNEINTPNFATFNPVISTDGLTVFFASDRPLPGSANLNVWYATRTDRTKTFNAPIPVGAVNSDGDEAPTWVSPDGCVLYIASDRPGGRGLQDIYVSTKPK
jgi:hypothetical protein